MIRRNSLCPAYTPIIKATCLTETMTIIHKTTGRHVSEEFNLSSYHRENIEPNVSVVTENFRTSVHKM